MTDKGAYHYNVDFQGTRRQITFLHHKGAFMRKVTLIVAAGIIVAMAFGCNSLNSPGTTAANPFVGTWKMNPAKSRSSGPLLRSYTCIITDKGSVQDWIDADGKAGHCSWAGKNDGKDYPWVGDPDIDTSSSKKISPNTLEYVLKKAGKEVERGQVVVSNDGMTLTNTGSNKDGTYSFFMEKQ